MKITVKHGKEIKSFLSTFFFLYFCTVFELKEKIDLLKCSTLIFFSFFFLFLLILCEIKKKWIKNFVGNATYTSLKTIVFKALLWLFLFSSVHIPFSIYLSSIQTPKLWWWSVMASNLNLSNQFKISLLVDFTPIISTINAPHRIIIKGNTIQLMSFHQ